MTGTPADNHLKYVPRLHVVLYQPEIPPNTGAVGRTCVAVGAKLWLVRPFGFELSAKTLRRAGLDYWPHLEWETVTHWGELIEKLPHQRQWLFTKRGTQAYSEVEYRPDDVLVFGSESRGLPASLIEAPSAATVQIPMRPQVRSINLSCSVAVACYEAVRQLDLSAG